MSGVCAFLGVLVGPLAVEPLARRLVRALEGVGAEEVALRLEEVGREVRAAELVKVRQRGRHGGARDPTRDAEGDDPAPRRLARHDLPCKVLVEHEVGKGRVLLVRLGDAVEHLTADNAATLPDARGLAEADAPLVGITGTLDEREALGIAADLRGVEGLDTRTKGKGDGGESMYFSLYI